MKPTTRSNYRTCIETHLIPVMARDGRSRPGIGGLRLQALTAEHLDELYRWLEREGKQVTKLNPKTGRMDGGGVPLAPKSVRHVHTTIRKALADAVVRGYVTRNVADLAQPPTQRQARSRKAVDDVWTKEQTRRFLEAAADDELAPLFHLALMTGMRRGELLGLRWSTVDLDEARLRVRWTVTQADGRPVEQDSTKTDAGERTIALDPGTVAVLRRHRQAQLEGRMMVGGAWEDEVGRVFTNPVGRLLVPKTVLTRLHRIAADAEVPPISIHGLRHTYATLALRTGMDVDVLSRRLGHADISITLSIYAHVRDADDQAAADVAAAAILG